MIFKGGFENTALYWNFQPFIRISELNCVLIRRKQRFKNKRSHLSQHAISNFWRYILSSLDFTGEGSKKRSYLSQHARSSVWVFHKRPEQIFKLCAFWTFRRSRPQYSCDFKRFRLVLARTHWLTFQWEIDVLKLNVWLRLRSEIRNFFLPFLA